MKISQKIYLPFKRIIGMLGSLIGIMFCLVLFWWWIFPINLIVTKGHPVFVQERYGKNKKVFKLIKFRSMKVGANPNLAPSEMTNEIQKDMDTKFGVFLRKTSLDETLQLFNILFGQMAFIGPRPGSAHNEEFLRECREKYNPSAYEVKPGITGYAQIMLNKGRNPKEKAYWDHMYVLNFGFALDVKIFFITVIKMFLGFKGNRD